SPAGCSPSRSRTPATSVPASILGITTAARCSSDGRPSTKPTWRVRPPERPLLSLPRRGWIISARLTSARPREIDSSMAKEAVTATKIALALLGASRSAGFRAPVLVEAAKVLGVSPNAMRVALSRLRTAGDIEAVRRGHYVLADRQLGAVAHVRNFRTGFAARVPWTGAYVAALTSDLSRRNAAAVRRRERALELVGMRRFRHGVYLRPDNLEGGRARLAVHLEQLGLDGDADIVGL